MGRRQQCLIAFLCLGITLTLSASRKEDLEKAAEIAVEKAAERAAERAVERALNSGNTTSESKLIRDSYSNVRKDPPKGRKEYDYGGRLADDQLGQDEDADDWSLYSRRVKFQPRSLRSGNFRTWSSKIDFKDTLNIWKRFPRSELSYENFNWDRSREDIVALERQQRVPPRARAVDGEISYPRYEYAPYEIKIPVIAAGQPYAKEKRTSYPIRVYASAPAEIPEPYYMEK